MDERLSQRKLALKHQKYELAKSKWVIDKSDVQNQNIPTHEGDYFEDYLRIPSISLNHLYRRLHLGIINSRHRIKFCLNNFTLDLPFCLSFELREVSSFEHNWLSETIKNQTS